MLVLVGTQTVYQGRSPGFLDGADSWDVTILRHIAQHGYRSPIVGKDGIAFFPGFPLVLKAFHLVIPNWVAAGLVVSAVMGGIAMVFLAKLAELEGADGSRAALYLMLSPYAVFLAVGYTESLFLAFAVSGWYFARQDRWPIASLLVAGAALVRVNGVFLAVALVVLWATCSRDRQAVPWLFAPFVAVLGYVSYLHDLTGDWLAWQHAQADGWYRRFSSPLAALRTTLTTANAPGTGPEYRWSYYVQIVCVAIALLLVIALLIGNEWAEAVYVGLSVTALACSTFYLSIERATLLWFPLWIVLARAATTRPWLHTTYLVVAVPLMAAGVLTFHHGSWTG